jgi:hypothetical protein
MLYPYKVFFCHTPKQTRLYQVSLVSGESGRPPIDGLLAVCHQNTSDWDTGHPFFHFMDVKPGETTACHFFGRGRIIWVLSVKEVLTTKFGNLSIEDEEGIETEFEMEIVPEIE